MMCFLVNASIVNAFILWNECSTRRNPNKYAHLDFHCKVAIALIARFFSQKRKQHPWYMLVLLHLNKCPTMIVSTWGNQMVNDASGTWCNSSESHLYMVAVHVTCIFAGWDAIMHTIISCKTKIKTKFQILLFFLLLFFIFFNLFLNLKLDLFFDFLAYFIHLAKFLSISPENTIATPEGQLDLHLCPLSTVTH